MTHAAERTTDWLSEPGIAEAMAEGEARAGFDPEELAASIYNLTAAVTRLNAAALGSEVLPWTDLAALLDALRSARQEAQTIEALMEVRTAKAMADLDLKSEDVDGVGRVEWHRGGSRKGWDHEALSAAVLDAHLSDRADGELPTPWEVRDWILEAAAPGYWRTTVLKGLGLDARDFSETTPGRLSVQITRPG